MPVVAVAVPEYQLFQSASVAVFEYIVFIYLYMLTKTAPMGSMFLCREGSCSRDRVNLRGILFRLSTAFSLLGGWLAKFLKYSTGFVQYSVLVYNFLPHL